MVACRRAESTGPESPTSGLPVEQDVKIVHFQQLSVTSHQASVTWTKGILHCAPAPLFISVHLLCLHGPDQSWALPTFLFRGAGVQSQPPAFLLYTRTPATHCTKDSGPRPGFRSPRLRRVGTSLFHWAAPGQSPHHLSEPSVTIL